MEQVVMNSDGVCLKACLDLRCALRVMKTKEMKMGPKEKISLVKSKRDAVIKYLLELSNKFTFSISTCCVALTYFDRISGKFPTDMKDLGRVATMCMLLAAKYEDKEISIPSFSYFYAGTDSLFSTISEIDEFECQVINSLRWNLGCITVAHYLGLFTTIGVVYSDDLYRDKAIREETIRYVDQFVDFFLHLSIMDAEFFDYPSSIQATAIVIASRKATFISPIWRNELEILTCTSFNDACPCFERLWQVFKENYPESPKDQAKSSPTNITAI